MTDWDVDSTDGFTENYPVIEQPYLQPIRPAAMVALFGVGFLAGCLVVWLINGVMFG